MTEEQRERQNSFWAKLSKENIKVEFGSGIHQKHVFCYFAFNCLVSQEELRYSFERMSSLRINHVLTDISIYLSIYVSLCLSVHLSLSLYIYIYIYVFINSSAGAMSDKRSVFWRSLTGFHSEFSGCHIKVKEPSLPYYSASSYGGRIAGFMPFLRGLVLCEMQTA